MAKEPTFSFPYEPYEIQKVFMKELYSTIENSKFGIFESPTGTGKSLSICCATLQWLKDNYEQKVYDLESKIKELKINSPSTEASNDWLQEEYEKIKRNQEVVELQTQLDKLKEREQKFVEMRQRVERQKLDSAVKKTPYRDKPGQLTDSTHTKEHGEELPDDQDLILEDTQQTDDDEQDCHEEETEQNQHQHTKVVIASRTHSQLSQLVGEIRKTIFREGVRVVTLASRQHYCINPEVTQLNNSHLINERCLELQKSSSKATAKAEDGTVIKKSRSKSCGSCPYYKQSNITAVKERLLVELMDIEDIVTCGKKLKGCPYYATKKAAEDAQVVLLSHCALVSPSVCAGLGVSLSGSVLLVDEGHGLTPALDHAHTHTATHAHTHTAVTSLTRYLRRYRDRLTSRNLLTLNQLRYVLTRLADMLKPSLEDNDEDTKIYTVSDFLTEAKIDHINLRPLTEFCKKSRLVPKLHGFSMRYKTEDSDEGNKTKSNKKNNLENFLTKISKKKEQVIDEKTAEENNISQECVVSVSSAMYGVLGVVEALMETHLHGRILLTRGHYPALKYLLLEPGIHFSQIITHCRAVVLCGGTMSPSSEFRSLLGESRGEIVEVSVPHVVPPHHLLALGVSTGPNRTALTLTHTTRGDTGMLSEVCAVVRNVCNVVPGGTVVFSPSYSFLNDLLSHLRTSGDMDHILRRKAVFTEPRDAKDVDQVLSKFAEAVKNKSNGMTGALLLSVVGGKLSEGLNFSDDLGRCVVVVGVPYPNVRSPELRERVRYLEGGRPGAGGTLAHNICMKAVNQSIGRAVRHINDYAVVLLVDQRYSSTHNIQALPTFVQKSFIPDNNFGSVMRHMGKFFASHKKTTENNV